MPHAWQAGAPRAPHCPTHLGQSSWRTAGIMSLRLCSQQGWPSTAAHSAGPPRSHTAVPARCSQAPTCRQHRWSRWGAFPGSRNSLSERLHRLRTAPSQANASMLQPCSQLHLAGLSPCPHLPARHQSPLQGKWQLSLPHVTDWHCGLRTYSCHSQFFPISPNSSKSPKKSCSLHHNPEQGWQHHIPLHISGAQHEAAATGPAKASLEGHAPAPDYNCQQQTLRDDCQD